LSLALTDLDKVLKRLVEVGSRRKWICYEELNTCLPDEFVDPEKIDELFVLIGELGIEMVDEPEMRRNQRIKFYAPLQTNLKFQRDEKKPNKPPKVQMIEEEDGPPVDFDGAFEDEQHHPEEPAQEEEILDDAEAAGVDEFVHIGVDVLDDASEVHHGDPIGDARHHTEIVRDQCHCHAARALELGEQRGGRQTLRHRGRRGCTSARRQGRSSRYRPLIR